jgi:hypothetical protein
MTCRGMWAILPDSIIHQWTLKQADTATMRALPVDRVQYWPSLLAMLWPVTLTLIWSGPFVLAFLGAPVVLLLWGISAFFVLSMCLINAAERAWRSALSLAVMPATALLAILNPSIVWGTAICMGDHLHLWAMRPSYLSQIATEPTNQGPRLMIFAWGGFVIGHAAVYDESDEIMLPPSERSAAWNKRAAGTELECGIEAAERAGSHFYIVRTGC